MINSPLLPLLLQGATALVLALSVYFAWRIYSLHKEGMGPYVTFYIEPDSVHISRFHIVVSNSGKTTAYNIQFKVDPDVLLKGHLAGATNSDGMKLSEHSILNGIKYLPPQTTYRILLGTFVADQALDLLDQKFVVRVTFCASENGNQKKEAVFPVALSYARSHTVIGKPLFTNERKVADEVTKIASATKKIAWHIGQIRRDEGRKPRRIPFD